MLARRNRVYLQESLTAACYVKYLISQTDVLLVLPQVCSFAQSGLTLPDPMGCSSPGSSVHEISQSRKLECAAISSSRGSSRPRDRTCVSFRLLHRQADSLLLHCLGSPLRQGLSKQTNKIIREFIFYLHISLCILRKRYK